MVSQQKQRGRRHGIASQLYSSRICCVQCVPIFPISRTFKNAALLHPPSNEWEGLSLSCYCICDKKQSKRDFFNGLTLVVVLASGDADVAGFKVPFRIRAGIWTEIKVFSQDVTFGKVIATAKRKQQTFRKKERRYIFEVLTCWQRLLWLWKKSNWRSKSSYSCRYKRLWKSGRNWHAWLWWLHFGWGISNADVSLGRRKPFFLPGDFLHLQCRWQSCFHL